MVDTQSMISEDDKRAFGELIIAAGTDSGIFSRLAKDPHGVIGEERDGHKIDTDRLPPVIHVVQSSADQAWLVVPDREMLAYIKEDPEERYAKHPPGYYESDTAENRYRYRVGDYVLAKCG